LLRRFASRNDNYFMALFAKIKEVQFKVGDTVRVHQIIKEGDKTRTQVFEGMVLGIKGEGGNKSFTVRKIADQAIGVERIWPLNSPSIEKIEVKKSSRVRRAKLYYVRSRKGKEAKEV
jgi:large subunit ribosomal protein L19